jgi:hypothetical protein
MAVAPRLARASSWAGIRIEIGKHTLEVFYSVGIDYPEQSRAIRDPSDALFSIAGLIQANAAAFASVDHAFYAELMMGVEPPLITLLVIEDPWETPGKEPQLIGELPVAPDVTAQVVSALCGRYPTACAKPPLPQVTLYACPKSPCPGQISFGSFPSSSLNKGWSLLPPKAGAKGIVVTREGMRRFFEPLD